MTERTPLKRLAREIQREQGLPYMEARRRAMAILAEEGQSRPVPEDAMETAEWERLKGEGR